MNSLESSFNEILDDWENIKLSKLDSFEVITNATDKISAAGQKE
jgi:hypothetical protein